MIRHRGFRAAVLAIACTSGACVTAAPAAGGAARSTAIYVVRHAERASSSDPDSPLSEAGVARAQALAEALVDAGVDAIITSQYMRTKSTAAPLAERLGLAVEVARVSDPVASSEALARRILANHAGETVLVVGHSNTVPMIVRALGGVEVGPLGDSDYGDIFLVVARPGAAVATIKTRFGAPF
jgi:broad specificity phosphatase PhoE